MYLTHMIYFTYEGCFTECKPGAAATTYTGDNINNWPPPTQATTLRTSAASYLICNTICKLTCLDDTMADHCRQVRRTPKSRYRRSHQARSGWCTPKLRSGWLRCTRTLKSRSGWLRWQGNGVNMFNTTHGFTT